MAGFLKKRKASKIAKLKIRVVKLEEENDKLKQELFLYRLRDGKIKQPPYRPMRKLMGNRGSYK